jgi:hypothetical protein
VSISIVGNPVFHGELSRSKIVRLMGVHVSGGQRKEANPFVDCFHGFGLKGQHAKAQGNALRKMKWAPQAPNGAK